MIQALLLVGFSFFNPSVPADSLGIQTINGKVFVIHKVDEKETLYSISKRYGTTVDAILQYNPTADAGLAIGQILKVPYVARKVIPTTGGGVVHTVLEKETLYSLSRMYNVTVDEIRQWNNLTSNALSIGQTITIKKTNTISSETTVPPVNTNRLEKGTHQVATGETLYSISRQYNVSVDDLRKWNNLQGTELSVGQIISVASTNPNVTRVIPEGSVADKNPKVTTPKEVEKKVEVVESPSAKEESPVAKAPATEVDKKPATRTVTISDSIRDSDEVVQSGVAELIEGTEGNRKYLALHRTAPVGTILKVRNEMNNREVFVRVMGKLPDTGMTENLIIKVSRSAYDRLGAIDSRFRVQVTYYK